MVTVTYGEQVIHEAATGGSSATITANASGQYKLLVIAMNSDVRKREVLPSTVLFMEMERRICMQA